MSMIENSNLWEEKNYTEQKTNSSKCSELELRDFTIGIPSMREKENSDTTTNKKVWSRKCPKCGTEKIYKYKKNYIIATNKNLLCVSCCAIGRIISEATKQRIREKLSGKNNYHYGKPGTNLGKKFSLDHRRKISEAQKGRSWPKEYREKMIKICASEKCRENKRKGTIKRILREKLNGSLTNRSYNPSACKYFDMLNNQHQWNLQHAENGGEIECVGYFLDAYDKNNNIVVEYDESRHYILENKNWILRKEDVDRMNVIKNSLQCKFYRYNEKLNTLTQY